MRRQCVARSPNGQTAAQWAAAAPVPLTTQEVRQQAQAEGLTLRRAPTKAGFFRVGINHRRAEPGRPKRPYHAKVLRGGEKVHLGIFATPEEAALCVARSPEGRAAAAAARGSGRGACMGAWEARCEEAPRYRGVLVATLEMTTSVVR